MQLRNVLLSTGLLVSQATALTLKGLLRRQELEGAPIEDFINLIPGECVPACTPLNDLFNSEPCRTLTAAEDPAAAADCFCAEPFLPSLESCFGCLEGVTLATNGTEAAGELTQEREAIVEVIGNVCRITTQEGESPTDTTSETGDGTETGTDTEADPSETETETSTQTTGTTTSAPQTPASSPTAGALRNLNAVLSSAVAAFVALAIGVAL